MKFFDKIINAELEEKYFKRAVIICILIIILVLSFVYLNFALMFNYKPDNDAIKVNKDDIIYKINSIQPNENNLYSKYIEIDGWAYKTGQNIGYFKSRYVIRNEETGKYKVLNTGMQIVDEFFSIDDKYDCRRAGMYAKASALGLKKGLYQIFIEYKNDDENFFIETGIFFNKI